MTLCECGCGATVKEGNRFIRGHHTRTEEWRKILNKPEVKENNSKSKKKYWSKPGAKEEMSKIQKKAKNTPEAIKNARQGTIRHYSKPGVKEEWSKLKKKFYEEHPEAKEKHRQNAIKRWVNYTPEEKENFLRKTIFKGNQKPNISETKLIPMVEPFGFRYNGKGPVVIGNKIPDYVHGEHLLLIEYDGDGGHNPNCGVPWVPDNQPELDNQRDINYHEAGYKILRLLPEDLQEGKEFIQNKVKVWMVPILERSVKSSYKRWYN